MPGIVPRWEWRTFGSRFGVAETRFSALTPSGVQESDEVYLVGGAGDNVKIRDDLMDIKVLARDRRRRPRALGAGDEGRVPAVRGGRRQGVRGASAPGAGARPRRLHAPGVPRRAGRAVGRPARGAACTSAGSGTSSAAARRRCPTSWWTGRQPHDRDRVRGRGGRRGRGGVGRARRLPQHELSGRPAGDPRPTSPSGSPCSTSAPTRSSSTWASASRSVAGGGSSIGPRSRASARARGRPGRSRPPRRRARSRRSRAWSRRRTGRASGASSAVATAGLRMAPNGREVVEAVRAATGLEITAIPGDEESRLAFLAVKSGLGLADGSLDGLRHRRRQHPADVRPRRHRRRAVQRRCRRGAVHRGVRPRRGRPG